MFPEENMLFGILLVLFQNEGTFKKRSRKMYMSHREKYLIKWKGDKHSNVYS